VDGFHLTAALAQLVRAAAIHANALHVSNADDQNADVVASVAIIGEGDQALSGMIEPGAACGNCGDLRRLDGIVKAVGTENKDVARLYLMLAKFDLGVGVDSKGSGQRAVGDFVVFSKNVSPMIPDQVAARIARMSDSHSVMTQCARDKRCRHAAASWSGAFRGLVDFDIGLASQAAEEGTKGFARWGLLEVFLNLRHGRPGGDFAVIVAADSIGKGEEPTVRAGLFFGFRRDMTQVVFIVVADFAVVGEEDELEIEHGGQEHDGGLK
jgi:hypothetical protein